MLLARVVVLQAEDGVARADRASLIAPPHEAGKVHLVVGGAAPLIGSPRRERNRGVKGELQRRVAPQRGVAARPGDKNRYHDVPEGRGHSRATLLQRSKTSSAFTTPQHAYLAGILP